uniref:Stereocilin LRR domain-containing protein n=1 Tax=Pelusios castaneus TaxID=367368 RepID=A0A8C8RZV4_9SAUR
EGTPALDVLMQVLTPLGRAWGLFSRTPLSPQLVLTEPLFPQVATWDEQALRSLTSLLMGRFPRLTPQLLADLSQFLPFMAVSDIMRLPPALLANESPAGGHASCNVPSPSFAALQTHSAHMKRMQKIAFAKLLLQTQLLGDVATWPQAFLRAVQPLLPHLPLRHFLQLSPQQIQGLAEGWQNVCLGLAQGHHVAHSLINLSRGAGVEQVHRLGSLACYLNSEELQALAPLRDPQGPVEQRLLACAATGMLHLHGQVVYALAELLRSANLPAVRPQELRAWRGIVPELGVRFLQRLSAAQLRVLLSDLKAAHLTPVQVSPQHPCWLPGRDPHLPKDPCSSQKGGTSSLSAVRRPVQLFGAAGAMQPVHILQLGLLATQLSERELQDLELSTWGALSVLGGLEGWTARQMRALVSSFLRRSGASVSGLALPELAALGHLLCGLHADEIQMLNSQEFSRAAPFMGSLKLSCSERQMEALAGLLTTSSAFGPVGSWGPEIFTEIGTLAAGLPDIALSSLVLEQIWALTPLAIAVIPAPKFTVVFSPAQLLGFTSAQASAVTPQQYVRLSVEQKRAVASAQFEGEVAQDGRGRNQAWARPGPSALALLSLIYSLG